MRVRYDGDGLGFDGLGGINPIIGVAGVGTVRDTDNPNDCTDQGTNDDGDRTVTITSAVTGTSTVTASHHAVHIINQAVFENLTATAVKHWVNYALTVTPTGINHAGVPHDFTVRLVQLVAGQPVPMVGEPVTLEWAGPGSISPMTCVTDTLGECLITASSSVTGIGTLTARWGILLHSGQLNLVNSAQKTWVDWDISITPTGKTNLVGTDHQFTVRVRYDGDGLGFDGVGGSTRPSTWPGSALSRKPTTRTTAPTRARTTTGTAR